MQKLHFGQGVLTVSDAVCAAVFAYAVALANASQSDVIGIPIYEDGRRSFSRLVIGPASQLFCTPAGEVDADMEDAELLADLQFRTRQLGPSIPAHDLYEPLVIDHEQIELVATGTNSIPRVW